jgi:hypothetical protein
MTIADAVPETSDTPSAPHTHTLHTAPSNSSTIECIFVLSLPDIDHLRTEDRGGELDGESSYLLLSNPPTEVLSFNVYPAVTQ